MIRIPINLTEGYEMTIKKGLLGEAGRYMRALCPEDGRRVCIVTDSKVNHLYCQPDHPVTSSLSRAGFEVHRYIFPAGEISKTMDTVSELLDFLAIRKFTRSDIVLTVGGGTAADIGGFAASIYLDGIRYVQMPTTFLSMVDPAIGGRVCVNLRHGRNMAGAYWQPEAVLFDTACFSTLSPAHMMDGIAEIIKAGMILDASIISAMRTTRNLADPSFLMEMAVKALNVKKAVIETDLYDTGLRKLLAFGSTVGGAIEKCSGFRIGHGHALAAGMAIITVASDRLGLTAEKTSPVLLEILRRFGFKTTCPYGAGQIADAAIRAGAVYGQETSLIIPERPGSCRSELISSDQLEYMISLGMQ